MSNDNEAVDYAIDDEELHAEETFAQQGDGPKLAPVPPLGVFLGGERSDTYSSHEKLQPCLALRECNTAYGRSNGCKYVGSTPAEFDRCLVKGSIAPMRSFANIVGHFGLHNIGEEKEVPTTICFPPTLRESLSSMAISLAENLGRSVSVGYLWSVTGCNMYHAGSDGLWYSGNQTLDDRTSTTLTMLSLSFDSPLSAHTQHAWYESQDRKDPIFRSRIFRQPQETTAVPGLIGTMRNNQQIDLALEEDDEQPDVQRRMQMLDVPGFLCKGYTPHSNEVGRVRAVCDRVSIRVLERRSVVMLQKCLQACLRVCSGKKEWLLYCMGEMAYCSTIALLRLRDLFVSFSSVSQNSATLHVNSKTHTALISVSSGVLLRRDANNLVISSISEDTDEWYDGRHKVVKPNPASEEGFDYYFSGFFKCVPYIAFDRPPRTLISSVQSVQAVTSPYGAGTSSVSGAHISKPLVSTPFVESITQDTTNGSECKLADLLPGEDLVVCFANFNDTNEDSIMMSDGSVQRGLFAHMAYSAHVLNEDEKVPGVGEYANMNDHRWWKSYSRRQQSLTPLKSNQFIAGGDGRGKIVSSTKTESGKLSVRVLRYSTSVTGDKIATGHGQKGTIKLVRQQDMPWGIDENGNEIRFDIVVSMSSISNRLTTGQYYEMVSGALCARTGKRLVVTPSESQSLHTETVLYDGKTGDLIERVQENAEVPVMASWGLYRVWQMTQLTWDKQHYTHKTSGVNSIVTQTGRTAGGGIRFGEMEAHSVEGSGLIESFKELKCRMDLIDTSFCCRCETFVQMCNCNDESAHTIISVPHSMLVFSYTTLLTTGYLTKFKLSF